MTHILQMRGSSLWKGILHVQARKPVVAPVATVLKVFCFLTQSFLFSFAAFADFMAAGFRMVPLAGFESLIVAYFVSSNRMWSLPSCTSS